MSKDHMRIAGFACLVLAVVFLFVAWERYSSHVNAVETANRMLNNSPMGPVMRVFRERLTGQADIEPGVPVLTTYSVFFSVISGISGAVLLVASARNKQVKHRQPAMKVVLNAGGKSGDS